MQEFDIKKTITETPKPEHKPVTQKQATLLKWKIVTVLACAVLIGLSLIIVNALKPTNYNTPFLLTQTLKTGDTLSFVKPDTISNSAGEWRMSNKGYKSVTYPGCLLRPIKGNSPETDTGSDLEETQLLREGLNNDGQLHDLDKLVVPVKGYKSGVEFATAEVKGTQGEDIITLYRSAANTGSIYTIIFSCDNNPTGFAKVKTMITTHKSLGVQLKTD